MQIQAEYDLELSRRAAKHPRIRPHPRIRAAGKPATLAKTASA